MKLVEKATIAGFLSVSLAACVPISMEPVSPAQAQAYADSFALPEETLTDHVYSGVIGSTESVIVFATDDIGLKAYMVNVNAFGGSREELPRLHDAWIYQEIMQVMFEDVDGDGETELLVVATFISGSGPNAAIPFHSVSVLDWTDEGVVRRRDIEELAMVQRLDNEPTASEPTASESIEVIEIESEPAEPAAQ